MQWWRLRKKVGHWQSGVGPYVIGDEVAVRKRCIWQW